MRKGLTFEAAKEQHRSRGRWLIFAAVAALAVGMTVSYVAASAWGADRQDAAQARFDDAVAAQSAHLSDTVHAYRRMLTVTQGFFEVTDPTPAQFARFARSLKLTDAHPAVIGLEFDSEVLQGVCELGDRRISRSLAEATWSEEVAPPALSSLVRRLRRRVEPLGLTIQTIRARGFILEPAGTPKGSTWPIS